MVQVVSAKICSVTVMTMTTADDGSIFPTNHVLHIACYAFFADHIARSTNVIISFFSSHFLFLLCLFDSLLCVCCVLCLVVCCNVLSRRFCALCGVYYFYYCWSLAERGRLKSNTSINQNSSSNNYTLYGYYCCRLFICFILMFCFTSFCAG